MKSARHPLDELLPLLEAERAAVLARADVLEVEDLAALVALARDPRIGKHLLARLSDTVALVDPGARDDLVAALRAAGHTPRTAEGVDP